MPKKYNWESHKEEIIQRYIHENRSLQETRDILQRDHQFSPAYVLPFPLNPEAANLNYGLTDRDSHIRIKTYTTKLSEWEIVKQKPLFEDAFLVEKVCELWHQNYSSQSMLHALEKHDYRLTAIQLRNLRLHPSVRLLLQYSNSTPQDQIEAIADNAVRNALESGQSLRWGAGAYTMANIRLNGILVSE